MTKFGVEQVSSIPPMWWRKLERSIIIGIAPAITAFVMQVLPADQQVHALQYVTFAVAIVKSVGIFLGGGESYPEVKQDAVKEEPQN
jgi:hypothetical protein